MLRRVVSLFLMPMVLLTQWASVGHCHRGQGAPAHTRSPHIHLSGFAAHQPGHHHHGAHGHCHHHHDGDELDAVDQSDSCDLLPTPSTDHDDDALYVPISPGMTALPKQQVEEGKFVASVDVLLTSLFSLVPPPASVPTLPTHSPPGLHPGACPLYLQMLTLLI